MKVLTLCLLILLVPASNAELVGSEDVDSPDVFDEESQSAGPSSRRSRRRRRRRRRKVESNNDVTPVRRRGFISRERPWWDPESYTYNIGFEALAPGSVSALGGQSVLFGTWFSRSTGVDFFFGFRKNAGTHTTLRTEVFDENAKTRNVTIVDSGLDVSSNIFVGANFKWAIFRNQWALVYFGAVAAFSPSGSTSTVTGTRVEATADTDDADDFTVTETARGTITTSRASLFSLGPKLGAELYPKWIPHLAIGIATGIVGVFGGTISSTTTTSSQTIIVVDGVPQPPATPPVVNTTTTTIDPGMEGSTFSLANTGFNLFGVFTVRIVW